MCEGGVGLLGVDSTLQVHGQFGSRSRALLNGELLGLQVLAGAVGSTGAEVGFARALPQLRRLHHLGVLGCFFGLLCRCVHQGLRFACGTFRFGNGLHSDAEGFLALHVQVVGEAIEVRGIFLGHTHGLFFGDITGETGLGERIGFRRILHLRLLRNGFGSAGDIEFRAALDLLHHQGDHVLLQRLFEVVADHQFLQRTGCGEFQFLAVSTRGSGTRYIHRSGMRLAGWAAFHGEFELAAARDGKHVRPVDVGAHIGDTFVGDGILHDDAGLAILLVEHAGIRAFQHGDHHRHLRGGNAVDVQLALFAIAAAGETRFLVLAIGHVEHVVIRRVHREVHVLRRAEDVQPFVVRRAEHVVATHAVVAFAAEVETLAVGMQEREVVVLIGVDVTGEFHRWREFAVGGELGAVDVAPGLPILAVAAEVDGAASFSGDVDQRALFALLVQG